MGNRNANAAVLVVAALFCTCAAAVSASHVDFFYFVLSWPGSYCRASSQGCCLPTTGEPELDFFVKGLYTANSSGGFVTHCSNTEFYVNALAKFIGDMYSYMPSIECPSNNGVSDWKELWAKYGVCSGFNETHYFSRSLRLRSDINLLPTLKRLGYAPRDGKSYPSGMLQAAITAAVGVKTKISCNTSVEGRSQLSEIWMCVDADATALFECPVYPSLSCPDDNIYFETFTQDMMKDTSLISCDSTETPNALSQ